MRPYSDARPEQAREASQAHAHEAGAECLDSLDLTEGAHGGGQVLPPATSFGWFDWRHDASVRQFFAEGETVMRAHAIYLEALARKTCLSVQHQGRSLVLAPYCLYRESGTLLLDAVVLDEDGSRCPHQLSTFPVRELSQSSATWRSFKIDPALYRARPSDAQPLYAAHEPPPWPLRQG